MLSAASRRPAAVPGLEQQGCDLRRTVGYIEAFARPLAATQLMCSGVSPGLELGSSLPAPLDTENMADSCSGCQSLVPGSLLFLLSALAQGGLSVSVKLIVTTFIKAL